MFIGDRPLGQLLWPNFFGSGELVPGTNSRFGGTLCGVQSCYSFVKGYAVDDLTDCKFVEHSAHKLHVNDGCHSYPPNHSSKVCERGVYDFLGSQPWGKTYLVPSEIQPGVVPALESVG